MSPDFANGASETITGTSRLLQLLKEVADAGERSDVWEALRFADAAHRLAPDDPGVATLLARALIWCGCEADALALLRGALHPDAVATRAQALFGLGRLEEAAQLCRELLSNHAVDCVDGLRPMLDRLCEVDSARFSGWVGLDSALRLVGKVPVGEWPGGGNVLGRVSSRFHPDFGCSGWVAIDGENLCGEVRMPWAPGAPITLVVRAGESDPVTFEVIPETRWTPDASLSIPLSRLPPGPITVSALLPNGRCATLLGSPVEPIDPGEAVAIAARPQRPAHAARPRPADRCVDIVIPVHGGREETMLCIESVLSTVDNGRAEVIVVDDASPDLKLRRAVTRLADTNRITLLTNPENVGFAGAVNRGLRLHPERDALLLNSDCEVYGDWLERLCSSAYRADDIATATPLGEEASIASYPLTSRGGCAPESPAEIDAVARRVNAKSAVEVPVGVGFCLFLRRACLNEVGPFDEARFGRGYGEENDFCLRARRRGWRHVVATDVFVRHRGGRSFGSRKRLLMARHARVLNELHPGYDRLIADFLKADPLRPARRAIDSERLASGCRKVVLLVTLDAMGGVRRFVDDRASQWARRGCEVICIRPQADAPGSVRVEAMNWDLRDLYYRLPQDAALLVASLRAWTPSAIELHHFLDLPPELIESVLQLEADVSVFLHDHSWFCPRITLMDGNSRYCGEPALEACESCVARNGSASATYPASVAEVRARSARWLQKAQAVYCASEDVRKRYMRHFPRISVEVVPWEADVPDPARAHPGPTPLVHGPVRVALLGAISLQKGHRILVECARAAAAARLPLEFVLIGYSCDDAALLETGRVFVTGRYEDSEIDALLQREQCRVALFASIAPETWCYCLTHALRAGLPIVAFDHGAFAERLRGVAGAVLLPLATSPELINRCLLKAAGYCDDRAPGWARDSRSSSPSNLPSDQARAEESNMDSAQTSDEPSSVTQLLTLAAGVYTFGIQEGAREGVHGERLSTPALYVGLAPLNPLGQVEFFSGPGTLDRWLAYAGDRVTVRVTGERAALLLTSLRRSTDPALSIDVRRVDAVAEPTDGDSAPVVITAHLRRLGDLHFTNGEVGPMASGLWIEALVFRVKDKSGAGLVEYRGLTADGVETPWLTDAALCGSRGRGTPLLGFAVRPRVAFVPDYECSYVGRFASGRRVGPIGDGGLCRSELPNDPLEGLELRLTPRS